MSRYPECLMCHDLCLCGQHDALKRPIHYGCQAELPLDERHPQLTEHPTGFAAERRRQRRRRSEVIAARLAEMERTTP